MNLNKKFIKIKDNKEEEEEEEENKRNKQNNKINRFFHVCYSLLFLYFMCDDNKLYFSFYNKILKFICSIDIQRNSFKTRMSLFCFVLFCLFFPTKYFPIILFLFLIFFIINS